jgi:Glyoxalase-like domain
MPVSVILLAASVFAADLKVDHITIAGRDLKQLQAQFAAAGIPSEYGGKHTNGLTEMAIASFVDGSYLELIGAQKPTGAAEHYWGKFIDANAGPCAWAVSVPDVAEAVPGSHPARSGRLRPDGVKLEWESASIGPEAQGTFFPFFIHDITQRELRAFPHGKPSALYAGVSLVVIGVRDLKVAVERYRKTFHLPAPEMQDDENLQLRLASFPGTPVVMASPMSASAPLAARINKFGEAPYAFVLDMADHSFRGFVGSPSVWYGRQIFWNSSLGSDHPWIGIRVPKH